jgi:hypothetical protein
LTFFYHLLFDSEKLVSLNSENNYEYLSDTQSSALQQKISTDYDLQQNVFTVTISYYDGDKLVSYSTEETVPVYDEEKDDAYVIVDENKYYFSDTFDVTEFEQCVALVDDAVIIGGAVIVGAVALTICAATSSVNYDVVTQITYEVQTFFESVKSAIRSFFSWFTRWIKVAVTKVVQKVVTTITKVVTPAISVNNERIETKEASISELKNKEKNKYFLVFADTTNGKIYLSSEIKKEIAIAILCVPAIVLFCICFVSFLLLSYIGNTQHLTKDNVICYNNEKDEFIISLFRKQLSIKVDDIREVKCKNKRLASLTAFLWVQEYVDGHLVFYLKNGTKIRTPMIKSVKNVQYEISEIVKRQ